MISTATARTGDIGVYINALRVVTSLNTVSVAARVAGQFMKVDYQEGQDVKIGGPLVEIDPAPYQAAVTQAEGQLARDTALLADAKLDLERYQEAYESNAIPQAAIRHAGRHCSSRRRDGAIGSRQPAGTPKSRFGATNRCS